jgi:hypothetical protein
MTLRIVLLDCPLEYEKGGIMEFSTEVDWGQVSTVTTHAILHSPC